MNDKVIPVFFLIFGTYIGIIGWLNLAKNKKLLSIFELADLYIRKNKNGLVAYEARKKDLLETSKHKIFAINYLFLGIITSVVGLYLLVFQ